MSTTKAQNPPRSRRTSISNNAVSRGRRDLPTDPNVPSPLSARKVKWAKGALKGSNFCNKTVGTAATGGQIVGGIIGGVVGAFGTGPAAKGLAGIYSTKEERDKDLYTNNVRRTSAIGGALVGGPILLAGGLADAVIAAPLHAGAYMGKKYLDKHHLERAAWSLKPGDKTRVNPGNPTFEPRLPIIHSSVWENYTDRDY